MKYMYIVFSILISGCTFISLSLDSPPGPLEEAVVSGEGKEKVLLIDISGLISAKERGGPTRLGRKAPSMVARVKEELEKARRDEDVKALVLRINSPGGTVTASDILYHEIKDFKEEKGVKVVACMMGLGTSGAYYISTSADKIVAHPTCVTGSIGVMLIKVNMKGLMEKIGLEDETVKSGEKKDAVLPFRSFSQEERQVLQRVIDNLHERFVAVVGEARPEAPIKERRELADGRVFTAQEALELHLVDMIGYLEDAIELAKAEAGLKEARVVIYRRPPSYKDNIYSLWVDEPEALSLINLELGGLFEPLHTEFMYLWMP